MDGSPVPVLLATESVDGIAMRLLVSGLVCVCALAGCWEAPPTLSLPSGMCYVTLQDNADCRRLRGHMQFESCTVSMADACEIEAGVARVRLLDSKGIVQEDVRGTAVCGGKPAPKCPEESESP